MRCNGTNSFSLTLCHKLFTTNDRGVDFYFEPASLIFEASSYSSIVFFSIIAIIAASLEHSAQSVYTSNVCIRFFFSIRSLFC